MFYTSRQILNNKNDKKYVHRRCPVFVPLDKGDKKIMDRKWNFVLTKKKFVWKDRPYWCAFH
jgi:hypothetical protein